MTVDPIVVPSPLRVALLWPEGAGDPLPAPLASPADGLALLDPTTQPVDVLVVHGSLEVPTLPAGTGAVLLLPAEDAGAWVERAGQLPVVLAPLSVDALGLRLALATAVVAARRQAELERRCDELQQRLEDRILVERAKGLLMRQQQLTEEEAYRRLRSLARRQRRPVRDLARAVLDAQCLLEPNEPVEEGSAS